MSKADVQTFTILAVAAGAVITIEEERLGGEAAPVVAYLGGLTQTVINKWPETGNPKANTSACARHCLCLKDQFEASAKLYTACCLGMLAQCLLIELRDRLNNRSKLDFVDELLESVNAAVDIYDPEEINDDARQEAERLCGVTLKEVGW